MFEYIFDWEGKKYITDADTQLDAEVKFEEEFGEDSESCEQVHDIDGLIYSEKEIIYF